MKNSHKRFRNDIQKKGLPSSVNINQYRVLEKSLSFVRIHIAKHKLSSSSQSWRCISPPKPRPPAYTHTHTQNVNLLFQKLQCTVSVGSASLITKIHSRSFKPQHSLKTKYKTNKIKQEMLPKQW